MKLSVMINYSLTCLLIVALSVSSLASIASDKTAVLSIKTGEVRVLDISGVKRVALGDPKKISYKTLDDGQVMLVGLEAGSSSVHIWRNGGREQSYWVDVKPRYISNDVKVAKILTKNIKGMAIYSLNDRLVLEGKINKHEVAIIDAVRSMVPDGLFLISSRPFAQQAIIRVDAVIVEIGSNDMKKIGIQWDSAISGPSYGAHKTMASNDAFRVYEDDEEGINKGIIGSVPFGDNSFFQYFGITSHIMSTVHFLENAGKARVLSSPKLTAISGESAKFHVGGTFPIPVINSVGAASVEREDYGVILKVSPTLDDDMIRLDVAVDLSDIDPSVTVNNVPGTKKRSTETVVQLRHNETVAISGLFAMADSASNGGVPYLSRIPIVKYFFGVDESDVESREVVVLLTPKIISPGNADDRAMSEFARGVLSEFDTKLTIDSALME